MDLLCPHCREPVDVAELHEVYGGDGARKVFLDAWRDFRKRGCAVFGGYDGICRNADPGPKNEAISEIYALLGDDVDGAAAMLEDFQWVIDSMEDD